MPDEPVRDSLARDIRARSRSGPSRGMGRGLSAILSVSPASEAPAAMGPVSPAHRPATSCASCPWR